MKQYAKELGFDAFQLTKSTKFGKIYEESYGAKMLYNHVTICYHLAIDLKEKYLNLQTSLLKNLG